MSRNPSKRRQVPNVNTLKPNPLQGDIDGIVDDYALRLRLEG
jgi:hypothetical protein